jgi:hypothetical protein
MNRVGIVLLIGLGAVGCGDALVGGRCLPGYVPQGDQGCVRLAEGDGGDGEVIADASAPDADSCSPLSSCDGLCVDTNTDPHNCGGCGNVCTTGICRAGTCRGVHAGHVVLIGHDYEQSHEDQDRVVGNAVFLASHGPVRVLTYVGDADQTPGGAVDTVEAAITTTGAPRVWTPTRLEHADEISAQLTIDRFDVMLVYEQTHATDEQIASVAQAMGGPLANFARAGGVVIVLDGPRYNGGTYPIANATGFFDVTGVRAVANGNVDMVVATDALAIGVANTYRARNTSVGFRTVSPYAVFVTDSATGPLPVVLHRAVFP